MLTLAWLRAHDACEEAVIEFQRLYPGGKAPLHEVVAALADHPQGPEWFEWLVQCHQTLQPHRDPYEATWQTAWDAYDAAVRVAMRDVARKLTEEVSAGD